MPKVKGISDGWSPCIAGAQFIAPQPERWLNCIRKATSQAQADTKFTEAKEPSAILQDSGS